MIKVLALDLDGTVLRDDQTVHPEVQRAIQYAKERCHVIIVTGRHHTAAYPYYAMLGLDTPILCCNGTYVYHYQRHQVMQHNAISRDNALRFIQLAEEENLNLVMYITDRMTYSRHRPITYMQALQDWAHQFPDDLRPNIEQIEDFSHTAQQARYIWKFVVEGDPECINHFAHHPFIAGHFSGEQSWSNRVDFAAQGNSKGRRLRDYLTTLCISSEEVMAAGDNHNDISMLNVAGISIAMLNAEEGVKQHASVICPTDNNEDGLARLIYQYI